MRVREIFGLFLPLCCTYLILLPEHDEITNAINNIQPDDLPILPSMVSAVTDSYNLRRSVPPYVMDPMFEKEHGFIDDEDVETRCKRFDLQPYSGPPRRIFFGAMVADETWDLFRIHATEVYDVYHAAVFVESNTTHIATPRKMRFTPNSLDHDQLIGAKMFGSTTKVYMHQWLEDLPGFLGMTREAEQRNSIIKVWKDIGMKRDDVGLMADIDEVYSRDFLRAVQTCDFVELRPNQSCNRPKIIPTAISYEGSPFCVQKRYWFHPDLIGGQCIEGIGDPTERIVPLRVHEREFAERHATYGQLDPETFPDEVKASGRYPLFNGPDIRTVAGDLGRPYNVAERPGEEETAVYGAAFHFHNWFDNSETLRGKYSTFAHGDQSLSQVPLAQFNEATDIFVRCVHELGNNANPLDWNEEYYLNGRGLEGNKPIFFLNKTYTSERHEQLKQMVIQDEKVFGPSYDTAGKWTGSTES